MGSSEEKEKKNMAYSTSHKGWSYHHCSGTGLTLLSCINYYLLHGLKQVSAGVACSLA
jgi:hypothetical protein